MLQMNKYFYTVYLITVKMREEICINEIQKNPKPCKPFKCSNTLIVTTKPTGLNQVSSVSYTT